MKKLIIISILFIFPMFLAAQNSEAEVKAQTAKIFELCKNNDFKSVGKLFAYHGKDATRNLKSSYNFENSDEQKEIKRICKKISSYLKISDKYEFSEYSEKEESGVTNYIQKVLFSSGNQKIATSFVFIKVSEVLLLGDID